MSGAYLSVNLHKQVLFELGSCRSSTSHFVLLVYHELNSTAAFWFLQRGARNSETFCHFFVTVNNFYLLDLRAEAIERRLVIRLAVDSDWLQKRQDGLHTRKKNHHAGLEKN